ncbi:MAG: hypothetical protein MR383_09845 [Lachnospiraceae bacterium]|nr:hypothetical protein [Lachnospiraceae bacterium]
MDNLVKSQKKADDTITVIYHAPRFLHLFEEKFTVVNKRIMYDSLKNYDTCILELKV